jgi:hypothetical protein
VFWHSLEHLRHPGQAIHRAVALLKPRGALVIAVPNADRLHAEVFGDSWLALDLPRHLVHLSARTLVDRARQRSLRVERLSYWRGGQVVLGWPHGLVGALPSHPDLYEAIRRPEAQRSRQSGRSRGLTLAAGIMLLPVPAAAAVIEILIGRGGTIDVEERRA